MKKRTRYVILGLLREEDLSGYEIKKAIDIRMQFFWQESYGQIYPVLSSLAQDGLVKEAEKSGGRQRKRTRYTITQAGEKAFADWMRDENEKDSVRSEALLKCYFATDSNIDELKRHLTNLFDQNQEQLILFRRFEKELTAVAGVHRNHKYILQMLSLGVRQSALYCDWSLELLQKINAGKL